MPGLVLLDRNYRVIDASPSPFPGFARKPLEYQALAARRELRHARCNIPPAEGGRKGASRRIT
jgi:hypothetical protein